RGAVSTRHRLAVVEPLRRLHRWIGPAIVRVPSIGTLPGATFVVGDLRVGDELTAGELRRTFEGCRGAIVPDAAQIGLSVARAWPPPRAPPFARKRRTLRLQTIGGRPGQRDEGQHRECLLHGRPPLSIRGRALDARAVNRNISGCYAGSGPCRRQE